MSDGQDIADTMQRLAREHDSFEAMKDAYFDIYPEHRGLYNAKDLLSVAWDAQTQARAKRIA